MRISFLLGFPSSRIPDYCLWRQDVHELFWLVSFRISFSLWDSLVAINKQNNNIISTRPKNDMEKHRKIVWFKNSHFQGFLWQIPHLFKSPRNSLDLCRQWPLCLWFPWRPSAKCPCPDPIIQSLPNTDVLADIHGWKLKYLHTLSF